MAGIEQIPKRVSRKRAAHILEAYGSEPARWPDAERGGVLSALNEFPDLAAARRSAADLDQLLDAAPSHAPAKDLAARIANAAARQIPNAGWRRWLAALAPNSNPPIGLMQPAAALLVAVTLGVVAGAFVAGTDNDAVAEEFLLLAFGPAYQMQALETIPVSGGAQ